MSVEQLTDAVQLEQFGLKVCRQHDPSFAGPIIYDESECPLCRLLKEQKLPEPKNTRGLSVNEQKRILREKGFLQ
jgi:hypothetical protein